MIWAAISTSSPTVSVALGRGSAVLSSRSQFAPRAASGTALQLLESVLTEAGIKMEDVERWIADLGPGSFTGVKVGVSMVKAIGFALGREVSGVSAFDLISATQPKIVQIRKGLWMEQSDGGMVERTDLGVDAQLAGLDAGLVAALAERLPAIEPIKLLPLYGVEPSISKAKNSIIMGANP